MGISPALPARTLSSTSQEHLDDHTAIHSFLNSPKTPDFEDLAPTDGQGIIWVDSGGGAMVPQLANLARRDVAQTFTEDQTIEGENHLRLGDAGVLIARTVSPVWGRNFRWDGTNYVRTLADNDAQSLWLEGNGDLVYYTNSDAGNTVGSTITWAEMWRISKAGVVTFQNYADIKRSVAGESFLRGLVGAEANPRVDIRGDKVWFGDGATALDTNLYRSAADTLKTDDSLVVGGTLTVGGAPVTAETRKSAGGGSVSGTAGTVIAEVVAATGKKLVDIQAVGRHGAANSSGVSVVITYTDDTTTTVHSTSAYTSLHVNNGGVLVDDPANAPSHTALAAKDVKKVTMQTNGSGGLLRAATIQATEVSI